MTSICEKCEFPAIASAREVSLGRIASGLEKPLTTLERWARALIILGYGLILLGAFIVRVAVGTSAGGTLIGLTTALLGGGLVYAFSKTERS
jgi:hypothetical protein